MGCLVLVNQERQGRREEVEGLEGRKLFFSLEESKDYGG